MKALLLLVAFIALPCFSMTVHPDKSVTLTEAEARQLAAELNKLMQANQQMYSMLVQQQQKLETCKPVTGI